MIKQITIRDIASYGDIDNVIDFKYLVNRKISSTDTLIDPTTHQYSTTSVFEQEEKIKSVNFFFGTNGAGKSTITKFLRTIQQRKKNNSISSSTISGDNEFQKCKLEWDGYENEDILIFDEKFIQDSFGMDKGFPALFPSLQNNNKTKKQISKFNGYLESISIPDLEQENLKKILSDFSATRHSRECMSQHESYFEDIFDSIDNLTIKEICKLEHKLFKIEDKITIPIEKIDELKKLYQTALTDNAFVEDNKNNKIIIILLSKKIETIDNMPEFWYMDLAFSFVYVFLKCSPDLSNKYTSEWSSYINNISEDDFRSLQTVCEEYKRKAIKSSLHTLAWKLANTETIKNNINTMLENSGFSGLSIKEKKDKGYASFFLDRDNMSQAKVWKSLSEGEKHYIAFLYFYQLCISKDNINASIEEVINSSSSANNGKVIVIDDPITSMDSETVFLVSSIIRKMIDSIGNNQLLLLTHNQYFYNEVTYGKTKDEKIATWQIKKDKVSLASSILHDYIFFNDYADLWKVMKDIKKKDDDGENTDQYKIYLANNFRRILETYAVFSNFGNSPWSTINKKDIIKTSFLSWINSDSHSILPNTELFYHTIKQKETKELFKIFKSIFEDNPVNDGSHYNRWMGN